MTLDFDKLLKQYAGFDEKSGNRWREFLNLEEDEGNYYLVPIRSLDMATHQGLLKLATEYEGGYEPKTDDHQRRYWIPKTPSEHGIDSQATYKEAGNEIPETPYNLETSMRGLGQLVPILEDAQGNIIDGFHRVEIDKKWPRLKIPHINNTVKLELARVATNYCRRTMDKEELEQKIGFLIGAGLTVQQISLQTGMSERSIYRYIPPQLKDQTKVKAGEAKSLLTAVTTNIKTQDTFVPTPAFEEAARTYMNDVVECSKCHLKVHKSRMVEGLCPQCAAKAGLTAPKPSTSQPPKPFKPKETWEHRKATMQPQVSKFELAFDVEAEKQGLPHGESQKVICTQHTIPDKAYSLPNGEIFVYFDGSVHEGREDRDEALRDNLRRWGDEVIEYSHSSGEPSLKEIQEAVQIVRQKLIQKGWKPSGSF